MATGSASFSVEEKGGLGTPVTLSYLFRAAETLSSPQRIQLWTNVRLKLRERGCTGVFGSLSNT